MARAFVLIALLAGCRGTTIAPETAPPPFAVLTPSGIEIHDGASRATVPYTEDVETFCWRADGAALFATTADALIELTPTGARRVLSTGWFAIRFPAASPNGKLVAVSARQKQGEPWGVWIVRANGKGRPRRTVDGYGPAWEADGTRIYFERYRPKRGLAILDVNTGRTQAFLDDGRAAHTVTCSRGGRKIVFTRGRALALFEPSKSAVRDLTGQRTYNRFPSVSPGERYVIFFRQDPTGETHPERALVILDLQTNTELILDVPAELAKFAP